MPVTVKPKGVNPNKLDISITKKVVMNNGKKAKAFEPLVV